MEKLKKFIRREIKKMSSVPSYDETSRGIWIGRFLTLDEIQKEIKKLEKLKLIKIKRNKNGNKIKCK